MGSMAGGPCRYTQAGAGRRRKQRGWDCAFAELRAHCIIHGPGIYIGGCIGSCTGQVAGTEMDDAEYRWTCGISPSLGCLSRLPAVCSCTCAASAAWAHMAAYCILSDGSKYLYQNCTIRPQAGGSSASPHRCPSSAVENEQRNGNH